MCVYTCVCMYVPICMYVGYMYICAFRCECVCVPKVRVTYGHICVYMRYRSLGWVYMSSLDQIWRLELDYVVIYRG